jgi:hypothetical protein
MSRASAQPRQQEACPTLRRGGLTAMTGIGPSLHLPQRSIIPAGEGSTASRSSPAARRPAGAGRDQSASSLVRIVIPLTLNAPASGPLSAYKTEEDIRAEFALKGIPFEVIHRLEFHRPEDVEDDVLDAEGPEGPE